MVAQSNGSIPVELPPVVDSAAMGNEIAELLDMQRRRTSATEATVAYWDAGACIRWNEIARWLVATGPDPYGVMGPARVYALLSVAQHDALVIAWNTAQGFDQPAPWQLDGRLRPIVPKRHGSAYLSEHAVVAAASATVLSYLFPQAHEEIWTKAWEHVESRLWAGATRRSGLLQGIWIGVAVGRQIVEWGRNDGFDAEWTGTVPVGDGYWIGSNPEGPMWGQMRPWLMSSGSQFRLPPPPAWGSPEFLAALAEVRFISDNRTQEQEEIAKLWLLGPGDYGQISYNNVVTVELIKQAGLDELQTARTLALVNVAVQDAVIAAWDSKYAYWCIRPSQADPGISMVIPLPSHPSYPSGHSVIAGALAETLSYLFPEVAADAWADAEECGLSRIYGGVHYMFDNTLGIIQGQQVAGLAIAWAEANSLSTIGPAGTRVGGRAIRWIR